MKIRLLIIILIGIIGFVGIPYSDAFNGGGMVIEVPGQTMDISRNIISPGETMFVNGSFKQHVDDFTANIFKNYEDSRKLVLTINPTANEFGDFNFNFTIPEHWELGNYYMILENGLQFMDWEFTVRQNHSGATLDRTVYPVPLMVESPLKQIKSGVKFHNVECKEGLNLAYKKADDTSACVKTTSMIELVIRGWAEDNRVMTGCFGDRMEICYPSDPKEYRKALYDYYFEINDYLSSGDFTKLQTINACTEHQICFGEFDNGTKIRVDCDYPLHGCGVIPFDRNAYEEDTKWMETKPEPEPEPITAFGNSVSDFEKATSGTMIWAKMPTYIPSEYALKDIRLVDNGGLGSMINLIYLKDDGSVSNFDTIDELRKNGLVITYTQGEKLDDFDWNTFVRDYVNEKPEIRAMSEQNGQVMLIEKPDLKKPWPGKSQIKIGYNDVFAMSLNLNPDELEKILWSIVENEN